MESMLPIFSYKCYWFTIHEKPRVNSAFNVIILLAKQFWIQLLFDYEYSVLEINIWEAGLFVLKVELLQFVYLI